MKLKRLFKGIELTLKKKAPDILVVAGVTGIVGGVILACKETTELEPIIVEHEEKKKMLDEYDISEKDLKKELTKISFDTGKKLVKLYAPSALLIGGSIGCIVGSHSLMSRRNASLAAAYTTLDGCFKAYRQNVVDRYGKDVDAELRHNLKVDKKQDEEGVTKAKEMPGHYPYDDYAKFFDEQSRNWQPNAEANLTFLKHIQSWANDKLQADGYLFLNEVYKALDIPLTEAGQTVGWLYSEDNPVGDNYVDFRIYDIKSEAKREFVNGNEDVVLLDFNVDGYILDKVPFLARV